MNGRGNRAGATTVVAEADCLCPLIEGHVDDLRLARLGAAFHLDDASFHLCASGRNTIYRVSRRFNWFLRLSRADDRRFMSREHSGAETTRQVLGNRPDYCGASVVRVAIDRGYVLASTIPGKPLNRVLATESWLPGSDASARLEKSFATLGTLLATLHAEGRIASDTPEATDRPFAVLKKRLDEVTAPDAMSDEIAVWYSTHERSDQGRTFLHGNMRLDNVLRLGTRLGFVDFEHGGSGSFYQDLAWPVSQLLLTRATIAFPRERTVRCLGSFLEHYGRIQPYEPVQLSDHVACRLAHYYLKTAQSGLLANRAVGVPVVRGKLRRLMCAVLRTGLHGEVPELRPQDRS